MDNKKLGILAALFIVVAIVLGLTNVKQTSEESQSQAGTNGELEQGMLQQPGETDIPPVDVSVAQGLPRLVDLGADKCIPCKKMAPILKAMKEDYAGRMIVEFIDVWKNPNAGKEYKIQVIPTQIFYDASGKELGRHKGFMSKEDILAKWKGFGFDFN
jgi:thioredoxin 1